MPLLGWQAPLVGDTCHLTTSLPPTWSLFTPKPTTDSKPHLVALLQLPVVVHRVGGGLARADVVHALAQRGQVLQQVLHQVLLVLGLLRGGQVGEQPRQQAASVGLAHVGMAVSAGGAGQWWFRSSGASGMLAVASLQPGLAIAAAVVQAAGGT